LKSGGLSPYNKKGIVNHTFFIEQAPGPAIFKEGFSAGMLKINLGRDTYDYKPQFKCGLCQSDVEVQL
jgi:hypothetical protein